jgi:glutamate dehydrogenase
MNTPDREDAARERVLERLLEHVRSRVPVERVEAIRAFALAYTHRLPSDELVAVSVDELFGQARRAFELADGRNGDEVAVRAFNPTLGEDGYQSLGSIVETSTEDSPYRLEQD